MKKKDLLKKLNLSTFVAFDFETTGLDPFHDRIIEVAAIRFENGEIADRFSTLVNPQRKIPSKITDITGISNSMVSSSPKEELIIDDLLKFLDNKPLVAHNIKFDESFLKQLCERFGKPSIDIIAYDTLQLARSILFDQPVFNLSALSDYYGLSYKGAHRAEKDTENTGKIFLELVEKLAGYPLDMISKINSFISETDIANTKLYKDLFNELVKKGDGKIGLIKQNSTPDLKTNTFIHNGIADIKDISAENVFGADGLLSEIHPNFEVRYNQSKYARLVDEILQGNSCMGVIEAGTGLGKSMAYLFGAIKQSLISEDDAPVMIACHTKHLQDQLFHKDLPLLASALNTNLKGVLLKGRRNYICKTRLSWLISDSKTLDPADIEALMPILFWLYWTKTGDLTECSGFLNSRRGWLQSIICSDSGFCTGEICNNNQGCYYGRLKKSVFQANIIVVNHSLVMTDTAQKGLLPSYNSIIIDEAHNLVKSAYEQFRIDWSEKQVSFQLQLLDPTSPKSSRWNNILYHISNISPQMKKHHEELKLTVNDAKSNLKILMEEIAKNNQSRFNPERAYQEKPIISNIDKIHSSVSSETIAMRNSFEKIYSVLEKIKHAVLKIDSSRSDYPILHNFLDQGLETTTDLTNTLIHLTENQNQDWVYWLEGNYKKNGFENSNLQISLNASVIDVSKTLSHYFFKNIDNCVLTSATLKVQGSFDYFLGRTGLDQFGDVITKEFVSPFLYNEQVSYFQYGGSREISNDPKFIADLIIYLHETYCKRMMVLFTSIKALSDTSKIIQSSKIGKKIPLFAQIRGVSKPAIIKGMYQNPNGVLFGTNSFWEGVDLPGDLLEILVLVKLPFDVPSDPLIKSYSDYINKTGGNSFMEFSIPEAAIRFRQGFGRLIRTSYDDGKFVCLDNRIVTKRYGDIFRNSLPVDMRTFSGVDTIQ